MKKTAVIFPGQGSQYIGMGQELFNNETQAAELFEQGSRVAGFSLQNLCFEGPMKELTRVLNLQPALTVVNMICWQYLKKILPDFTPACLAGHSLGEYSALYAAGVLSEIDTLALVTKRGELMEREGQANPGGMRAVLGMDIVAIRSALAQYKGPGVAVVANHNTSVQVVLSGDKEGLDGVSLLCKEAGAKVIPLKVSVANHSPLVANAVGDFAVFMEQIEFEQSEIPVFFNVTADAIIDPAKMKTTMAKQIASPVRWLEIVEKMVDEGVELIVELGPKTVLTGMMKKILPKDRGIVCMQADSPELIEKAALAIRGH